ncbi:Iterative polyketide synthase CazM 8 [Seiridium cupressi]
MSQARAAREDIPAVFRLEKAVPDRLVHLIPDELARKVPDHPLFAYPRTEAPENGFVEISAKSFANAINRASWYLASVLGKAPDGFPTIAYMGSSDLRYFIFMFGAIKAGYKMLYLSPRNSVAGHINVLEKTDCSTFLVAKNTNIDHILREREMKKIIVPNLDYFVGDGPVPMYPYGKTFAEARKDPCLVLHTTGSTGLPKPITWKLEILSTYEAWRTIPSIDGYMPTTEVYQEARRVYNSMPLFHTSGLNIGITMSLVLGVTTVLGTASVVPHAAYADRLHQSARVDASIGPPSLYEELSHDPSSLEQLGKLRYILVCGAPLSQAAGDTIIRHTRVISNFGATETACMPRLAPAIEDWAYFYWHPSHSGIELRDYMDELYELFLVRDPELELYQGIFSTFPDLEEYSMNDVYSKHPDPNKPFLYKWTGRADDVIVLSNGEKLAPALMEASLRTSGSVKGAMIVGRGKFQPAALVDLGQAAPGTAPERHVLLKELQPAIDEANKHAPAHGKLDRYHILFVDQERPIVSLGQGKIQRHKTYDLYEKDIEELYQSAENLDDLEYDENMPSIDFVNKLAIEEWLRELIKDVANIHNLEGDTAFFEAGLDSLHVLRIVRELKLQTKRAGHKRLTPDLVSPTVIYESPSLNELSRFLSKQASKAEIDSDDPDSVYQSADADDKPVDRKVDRMESLLDKYVQALPIEPSTAEGATVILTGSTGSLGSYLLSDLIDDPSVAHIICLDRNGGAAEKYERNADERGLHPIAEGKHVEFFKANLGEQYLGLEVEVYERLSKTVTHVIHGQWPVNFNWALPSFEPYIAGVKNLATLAKFSNHNAFILFVSSIAAVGGWKGPNEVPEAPMDDLDVAAGTGYGQSKLIAERLLDEAAKISGVRSAICRVGIVAGPVDRKEAHMGVFPETFPVRDHVDWLPVDKVSKVLIEILSSASQDNTSSDDEGNDGPSGTKVYHVVNPQPASWYHDVAPEVLKTMTTDDVKPVPFREWLATLKDSANESERQGKVDVERNPAIRLVDFYENATNASDKDKRALPSAASKDASRTLRNVEPVNQRWLRNWMEQWGIKSK